jgi:cobalt-zinc-cadmium efflux system protein
MPAASAHVLVADGQDCHAVRADLEAVLAEEYKFTHTTLQVDHAPAMASGSEPGHCEDSHGPTHRPTESEAG